MIVHILCLIVYMMSVFWTVTIITHLDLFLGDTVVDAAWLDSSAAVTENVRLITALILS